jgi:putative ABC transport system permease protein
VTFEDVFRQAALAILGHRQRSVLTMLGIVIGIASVILLTSIGEGTRLYILKGFTQFGSNLVAVNPGKTETSGMQPLGATTNPLTLEDSEALTRIPGVSKTVPVAMGAAPVKYGEKERNVFIYGVTHDGPEVWSMEVRVGRFLPEGDPRYGSPVAALGPKLKRELFGEKNALGEYVRIAGRRFMVVGVMESKGQFLGFDIDDSAYIPVALAMPIFNRDDLLEIDLLLSNASVEDSVVAGIRRVLMGRHDGHEDFTITTQTGMMDTLDRIFAIVSLAVAGIGSISLLVGAIGILTMMWISVNERTSEIGLAKAIGATPQQILWLYLSEAAVLSTVGGVIGLAVGMGLAQLIHVAVPALPVSTPPEYVALALGVSLAVGLLSGILPARRAAAMDPVEALAAE